MGAMHNCIDRHLYLSTVVLCSFIVAGDPNAGFAVMLDFDIEVDRATANLAILYVVLTMNRGIDQYADVFPAVGTFDAVFVEFSHVHLVLRSVMCWGSRQTVADEPKTSWQQRRPQKSYNKQ